MGLSLYGVARVYGDQTIFEDVSLILAPGERLGLVGENGSGKSSLLRVMAGLEAPDTGSVSPGGPADPVQQDAAGQFDPGGDAP